MPIFTFKASPAEARAIRARARSVKAKSVSTFLRAAALGGSPAPAIIDRRIHPVSSLPYNAAPGRAVSAEEIQSALADFP